MDDSRNSSDGICDLSIQRKPVPSVCQQPERKQPLTRDVIRRRQDIEVRSVGTITDLDHEPVVFRISGQLSPLPLSDGHLVSAPQEGNLSASFNFTRLAVP